MRKAHFLGIAGTGMGAAALLAKELGWHVTGSDHGVYAPMSEFLEQMGIEFADHFDASNVRGKKDTVFVVGNAVSRGNAELEHLLEKDAALISMPEFLQREILPGRERFVVTGTHGKTTTVSLLAYLLQATKYDPGYFIGGLAHDLPAPSAAGTGPFVLEGDEYDSAFFDKRSKFLHYWPHHLLINNLEFDHADIFSSYAELEKSFRHLIRLVPRTGRLVIPAESTGLQTISQDEALCSVETFGFLENADWRILSLGTTDKGISFILRTPSGRECSVTLGVWGRHNALNATGALALLSGLGNPPQIFSEALENFTGVRRRQELIGEISVGLGEREQSTIAIFEDFAHHPTAIEATLQGFRERFPGRRIVAVVEPRSNTMVRSFFQDSLPQALAKADEVFLAPLHRAEQILPGERLDVEGVVKYLTKAKIPAHSSKTIEDLLRVVQDSLQPGDIVVSMSNGGFQRFPRRLCDSLREKSR